MPEGTKLVYDVDAQVGGKLAMLGSRLIDSTARSLAGQFFEKFAGIAGSMKEASAPKIEAAVEAPQRKAPAKKAAAKKPAAKKAAAKKTAAKKPAKKAR